MQGRTGCRMRKQEKNEAKERSQDPRTSQPDCSFSSSPRGSWEERFPGWRESSAPILREIGKAVASSDRLEKVCQGDVQWLQQPPLSISRARRGRFPLNLRKQVAWMGSSPEEALLERRLDGKQSTAGLQTVLDWGAAGFEASPKSISRKEGFDIRTENLGAFEKNEIPRGPVQQPLEDRIFTPTVSAVYSTVTQVARQPGPPAPSPYSAHEISKGHPALAATPPGHASSPGLTQ
ncbi:hypothetical protein NXF25_017538, partial [Crotalus adamanteus]